MRRLRFTGLAILGVAGLVHCSSSASGTVSCTQMIASPVFTLTVCTESAGLTSDQENALEMTCRVSDGGVGGDAGFGGTVVGTFRRASCDRTNALGGCRVSSGGFSQVVWYYSGGPLGDANTARTSCTGIGETWVNP
jgi:hypothetical protein